MLKQDQFPFGNPTKENRMIAGIIFITIIAFAASEVINIYKSEDK